MKIAFTAPMKPLDDPVPSGDRTMGRLIVGALQHGGHEVEIATRFRAWRKEGSAEITAGVKRAALEEADRIAANWRQSGYRPDLFLTYHLYHKAPDWIGPALAERFDLPYAIIEASRAPKRKTGPWAAGFAAADEALARANAVAALHKADSECLADVLPEDKLHIVLPFIDSTPFEATARPALQPGAPLRLLAVGMMREGDKEKSYQVLAQALERLLARDWRLTIVGDGPARGRVEPLFPADRVSFLGAKPPEDLPAIYACHDVFVWPAIREAFGLVFLEAQASGLAIAGGSTFGVPDIVRDGETGFLAPEGDDAALAAALSRYLDDPALAQDMGRAARRHVARTHTLAAGAARIDAFLQAATSHHTASKRP